MNSLAIWFPIVPFIPHFHKWSVTNLGIFPIDCYFHLKVRFFFYKYKEHLIHFLWIFCTKPRSYAFRHGFLDRQQCWQLIKLTVSLPCSAVVWCVRVLLTSAFPFMELRFHNRNFFSRKNFNSFLFGYKLRCSNSVINGSWNAMLSCNSFSDFFFYPGVWIME